MTNGMRLEGMGLTSGSELLRFRLAFFYLHFPGGLGDGELQMERVGPLINIFYKMTHQPGRLALDWYVKNQLFRC